MKSTKEEVRWCLKRTTEDFGTIIALEYRKTQIVSCFPANFTYTCEGASGKVTAGQEGRAGPGMTE